ncbi:hypothetical protein ACWEO4_03750 [Streptomyces sp. NPDC004393]|uniref:hypothetical protein n=1 Tax=Streptomyces sp. NPDC004533 TaxID=3154278 RepID=UPI0033A56113
MMRSRMFAVGTALAAALLTGATTEASADVQQDEVVSVQNGDAVYGWVSGDYLQAHPGFLEAQAKSVAAEPQSHFGCNADVCIDVQGTGLKVNMWNTTANANVGCGQVKYVRNSSQVFESPSICPPNSDPGVYYYYAHPNMTYPQNTKLCNAWTKITGYPCATVHR